jgi:hypothetical protein
MQSFRQLLSKALNDLHSIGKQYWHESATRLGALMLDPCPYQPIQSAF